MAEPSVSTAARCRTMALRRAMRCTPIDSTAVTTAGQALGHRRNSQRDAEDQDVEEGGGAAHVLDQDDRGDHDDGDRHHDEAEDLAGAIQLALQRRPLLFGLLQESGNATHLGAHPGRGHDRRAMSVGRRGAAVDHVVAVAQRNLLGDGCRVLGDGQALARQRGFRRLEARRLDEPRVGGDRVAFFDQDDVPRDDLGRRDASPLAAADHRSVGGRHRAKRGDGRLRARTPGRSPWSR